MKCCMPFCEQSRENLVSDTCSEMGKVTFHLLPPKLRNAWLKYIGINESELPDDALVCSQHFQKDDFHVTKRGSMKLKKNSIPSEFRHNLGNSMSSDVQVCMICLDTASKLCPFTKYLMKAYSNITGLSNSRISEFNIEPKLCTECVKKLRLCNKFRDKCLSSHDLISQVYKQYGMLTLENIANGAQLKSNKAKNSVSALHFKNNLEEAQNVVTQSAHNSEQCAKLRNEINRDIIIDPKDIVNEVGCDLNDSTKDAQTINILNKDNSNTDVICLNDDIDHDMDFINENDNCVSIFNENIPKEDKIKNNINSVTINNKSSKATPKVHILDSENTFNKTKVKLKNDTKLIKRRQLHGKLSKSNKKHSSDDMKNMENVAKSKTEYFELKLFTVNVLSYEEQLAEVQKRKDTDSYKRSRYKCTVCFKGYWLSNSYNQHMEKHTNKNGHLVCAVCGFHMKTRCRLVTHIKKNHDLRFSCKNCPFTTNNKSQAQDHEQWHNGRKFCCPHCEAEFTKLKRNEPQQNIERRPLYPNRKKEDDGGAATLCELCGKSFKGPANLRQHMSVHTGEKGYKCDICDKGFKHKPSLALHSVCHGANPARYECGVCGKKFTYNSNRQRHMAIHQDTRRHFKCDVCDKKFAAAQSRNAHVSHVHSNVPWPKRVRSSRPRAPGTRRVRRTADTSDSLDS
ncbi:zinc finger protein 286A-like isoform X3 [Pararge aegeria]|uniref:zinc finger protein 286A-like isoform X3 n=1 Tax=Pararge aegeria TaxID=116150 RepID=UPI0019CF5833|nr:zinc finger protein 286A-like isoform X3 [Pararge aegeria]